MSTASGRGILRRISLIAPDRLAAVARARREVEDRVRVEEEPGDGLVVGSGPEAGHGGPIEDVADPRRPRGARAPDGRAAPRARRAPAAPARRARTPGAAPPARRRPASAATAGTGSNTTSAAHGRAPRPPHRGSRRRATRRLARALAWSCAARRPAQGGVIANSCLSLSCRASLALRSSWKACERPGRLRRPGRSRGRRGRAGSGGCRPRPSGGRPRGAGSPRAACPASTYARPSTARARRSARVGAHGLLEAGDRLRRLLRVEPRLAEQQVQLRRVRLVLQEVLEERPGLRVLVGDEGERRLLAADPPVVRPAPRPPSAAPPSTAGSASARAATSTRTSAASGEGGSGVEAGERLAGQLAGGAGGPVAALRGAAAAGPRRGPSRTGPRGSRTPGSAVRQSGGGTAFAFSRSTRGPVRVAAPLVDLGQGLVGLGEPGSSSRSPRGRRGKALLSRSWATSACGDEQRTGRTSPAPSAGASRRRCGTGPRSCARGRTTPSGPSGSCSREDAVLARGRLPALERQQRVRQHLPAPRGGRAARPRTSAGVRPPGPAGPAPCTPRRGRGRPGARSGCSFRAAWRWGTASREPPGHRQGHAEVHAHAGLVRERLDDRAVEGGGLVEAARRHRLLALPGLRGRGRRAGGSRPRARRRGESRGASSREGVGGGKRTEENGGCGTAPHPPFVSIDRSELHPQPEPELALGRVARGAGDRHEPAGVDVPVGVVEVRRVGQVEGLDAGLAG